MKITIRNKLLLYFSALILVTLLAQLIFNLFFADSIYIFYKKEVMEQAFYSIADSFDGEEETIAEILYEIESQENIQIVISNETEYLYVTTPKSYTDASFKEDMITTFLRPDSDLNYSSQPQANKVVLPSSINEVLDLAGEFTYNDEKIYVSMSLAVESIEQSASFFTNSNLVIAIVIFIFGALFSVKLSKSITKPLEEIEQVSKNLADFKFTEYAIEENSTKEFESLAKSINLMSRELQIKIDELNTANNQLHEDVNKQMRMEQIRKEFVANVSHEMKTPLAILQFYCENLKSDIKGIDKEYYYDTIIEETKRMDEMVKSMLDISKLENGLEKMKFEIIDFSAITKHTIDKLQPLFSIYQVDIDIENDLILKGDSRFLEQAIKNYITNAIAHTQENNLIQISLCKKTASYQNRETEMAYLSVYNEGKQIDPSELNRIWESFYKSDKSRVRVNNTNVGLGLYIVKCIMDNHEGNCYVENKNNGVVFSFEIPIYKEQ